MTDYDKATLLLIADLEAAVPSPKRDAILERARAWKYHDFHPNAYATPQLALYDHLQKAGLGELADNVKRGKYYEPNGEGGHGRPYDEDDARDVEIIKRWVDDLAAQVDSGKLTLDEFDVETERLLRWLEAQIAVKLLN